jgi:hypothetical protein
VIEWWRYVAVFASVAALAPVGVLLIQCLAALLGVRSALRGVAPKRSGTLCVLIPAHNEEQVLGQALMTVMPQLAEGDQVLVVADNPRGSHQKRPVGVTSKPASKTSADAPDLALISFCWQVASEFRAPALRPALEDMGVVKVAASGVVNGPGWRVPFA